MLFICLNSPQNVEYIDKKRAPVKALKENINVKK